jgi:SAM-dependent methyltransferase
MEADWLKLWREISIAHPHAPMGDSMKRYKVHARQGHERPDPLLDFVIDSIDNNTTVLDIGSGSGRWAIPLARKAKSVTAVEPSDEMLEVIRGKTQSGPENITLVKSSWEKANIGVHDIAVCAHAMYSSPDLAFFVRKMEQHVSRTCYLAIRLPPADGVISELYNAIHDSVYDSTNAIMAYNALYSMGIYANVLVEKGIVHWTNDTLEEALARAKRHLYLESDNKYDKLIQDTLKKRLTPEDNGYVWPDGMRSALLYWNPADFKRG